MFSVGFLLFICAVGIVLSVIGIMLNEKLDGQMCYNSTVRRAILGIIIMGLVLASSSSSFMYCIKNCNEFEKSNKTGQEKENIYVAFILVVALAALALAIAVHMEISKDIGCSGEKGLTLVMIFTSSGIAALCLGYYTMRFIDGRK